MCIDICKITRQTVIKYNIFHMSYYFVSITIRWFKEAIHQNVDIFWDNVPCSSDGTIHGISHVNPYAFHVEFQVIRGTYSTLVTDPSSYQPCMVWGGSQEKTRAFQQFKPLTNIYNMFHTIVSLKAEQECYTACLYCKL